MPEKFQPYTPLEHAVREGNYDKTLAILRLLSPVERRSNAASARRMVKLLNEVRWISEGDDFGQWGMPPTDAQQRAANAVLFVCGNSKEVAESWIDLDDLVMLGREFKPDALNGLVEAKLAITPYAIAVVQKLVASGLVPRPDSDAYSIGLICLPRSNQFDKAFEEDPGLRDVLLRIMEVEGTSECNLAAIDKYSAPEDSWSSILLRLSARGQYSRDTLLDRTLSALERDWPQFRSGWFSRFHGELKPSLEMLEVHKQRYLALCHSRIPPTVTFALGVLKQLDADGLIDSAALFDALRPVMTSGVKGQITTALKLIDRHCVRDTTLAREAAELSAIALAHESADLQKQVLQRLQEWGVSDGLQARLVEFLPVIAAVNRPILKKLLGHAAEASSLSIPAEFAGHQTPARLQRLSPLDESRLLPTVDGIDALVACIAHFFENDTDVDSFEMACAALARTAPLDTAHLERLGPVIKRATKVRKPMAQELAKILLYLVDGRLREPEEAVDHAGHSNSAQRQLTDRSRDWLDFMALGKHLTPLSSATHRNGFLDPELLIERVLAHQAAGATSTSSEQVRALLRLNCNNTDDALVAARALSPTPFVRALRYALGDDISPCDNEMVLFSAASRVRHPNGDDKMLLLRFGDLGPDGTLAARYTWSVRSRTSKLQDKTYTSHSVSICTTPVKSDTPGELLSVQRHVPAPARYQYFASDYFDNYLIERWAFGGIDEGLLRFSATLAPACLEPHFADGARVIGNNLDWDQAQWQDKVYLERLLDPAIVMTPMATLLLALGLAMKESGQNSIAVDALVGCHLEGRLDLALLQTSLGELAATPLTKWSRYTKSFRRALQLEPRIAPVVFNLLCSMLDAASDSPPKDLLQALELLQEVKLANGYALPTQTSVTLRAWKCGGRARTLQKAILTET